MPQVLDRQKVRAWLSGQRAAADRNCLEKAAFLLSLTAAQSLQIYLELWSLCKEKCPTTGSPLLLAMRRALSRMEGRKT